MQQIYVDLDFTFFQKPAGDVVKRWYSAWADAEAVAAKRRPTLLANMSLRSFPDAGVDLDRSRSTCE